MLENSKGFFSLAVGLLLSSAICANADEPWTGQTPAQGSKHETVDNAQNPDASLDGPPQIDAQRAHPHQSDQVVRDESGGDFMEEVPTKTQARVQPQKRIKIDLQNVGVSVDENGKMIPMLNRGGPAVVPSSTQFQQTIEPIAPNIYGYGVGPNGFSPFGMNPYGYGPYPVRGFRPFVPFVERNYTYQQQTVFFGPGAPWFAPPALSSPSSAPTASPVNPYF